MIMDSTKRAKPKLEAMIDWVQITFKELNYIEICERILCFDPIMMEYMNRGRFRYAGKWSFSGIEILVPPPDYLEMGHHLYMTGSACRSFEIYLKAQGRTWYDFFTDCLKCGGKFTRLDIAIDDRKPYFYIPKLSKKIGKGECVTKFRNRVFLDNGTTTGESRGHTINLGSGESLCNMVFYEKNYEQSIRSGLPVESYGLWNRYEVRLRKEMATNCIKTLVERKNICFIGLEIINEYMRVVIKNPHDSNRARWKTWKPWQELLDGIGKIKLSMRPAPRTLEQKKLWVSTYVAPTLKMIQIADDNLEEESLKSIIEEATLKTKHIRIVQDFLCGKSEMENVENDTDCF